MGKGGEMNTGKGDESGGYENPNYPVVIGEDGVPRIGACAVDPLQSCLLYTSPSPRDGLLSRMPSSA